MDISTFYLFEGSIFGHCPPLNLRLRWFFFLPWSLESLFCLTDFLCMALVAKKKFLWSVSLCKRPAACLSKSLLKRSEKVVFATLAFSCSSHRADTLSLRPGVTCNHQIKSTVSSLSVSTPARQLAALAPPPSWHCLDLAHQAAPSPDFPALYLYRILQWLLIFLLTSLVQASVLASTGRIFSSASFMRVFQFLIPFCAGQWPGLLSPHRCESVSPQI